MGTWSESNWFAKLDNIFEMNAHSKTRLYEKHYEHGSYGKTALSEKIPSLPKFLRPDNVRDFMKLWKDYFRIWIEVPEGDSSGRPDIFQSDAYWNLKESLENFHKQVSMRACARDTEQLKDGQDDNEKLESAARLFCAEVSQCAIDIYDSLALKCVELTADQNIKLNELSPQDREQFIDQYSTIIKEQLEEFRSICEEHANDPIRILPRGQIETGSSEFKNTTFEIRGTKHGYVVFINAKSNLLKSGRATGFRTSYVTGLKGINGRANSNKLNDLKDLYKCKSFISTIPALEKGRSNSSDTEKSFYSEKKIQEFFRNGTYQAAMRLGYFQALSEENYSRLLTGSSKTVSFPAFDSFPSLEALHVATFTENIFDNKLGGALDLDSSGRVVLRTKSGKELSVEEALKLWRNLYKADVIYVIDHPSKTYSNGTPVKLALPIQVKYLDRNSNVLAGKMAVSRKLLKQLQSTSTVDTTLIKDIVKLLTYRGYVLVVDNWNRRYFLGGGPAELSEDEFYKGDDTYKDFKLDLTLANCKMYLRVPDINIIEEEDKQRAKQDKPNLNTPIVYLVIKK